MKSFRRHAERPLAAPASWPAHRRARSGAAARREHGIGGRSACPSFRSNAIGTSSSARTRRAWAPARVPALSAGAAALNIFTRMDATAVDTMTAALNARRRIPLE